MIFVAAPPAFAHTDNPAPVSAPNLQPGDTWVYDRTQEDGTSTFSEKRIDLKIERVGTDTLVEGIKADAAPTDYEDHIAGVDWSQRRIVDGQETVTGRPFSFPLVIGKTWTADYVEPRQYGLQTFARFHTVYKVVGWEDVVVPAGTFRALKVEANGTIEARMAPAAAAVSGGMVTPSGGTAVAQTARVPAKTVYALEYSEFYYVPAVKYYVKSVEDQYNSDNVRTRRVTETLVSFKASP
ncbi:MAG: hypothetical protein M3T55_06985 [Pseudomonadota bacterium]|nr:hypothetical protein [Pseudomonadota bacterium]